MTAAPDTIREEHFENEGTGVEVEDLEQPSVEIARPWDPAQIRVSTRQYSLRNIIDMIGDGDLELAPDFQRNRVWKNRQRSRLVESVLLQIPLPAFYFVEDESGQLKVVDGLQRLSTIYAYVRETPDSFKLTDLEYLDGEEGKRFAELAPAWRRRILNAQIMVHVIDPTTPASVKYDIFKRINTGGTPLNAQEVRHCMSKPRSREFLRQCTELASFDVATGGRLRNHIRMDDREVVLRYCAFRLFGIDGYAQVGSMDAFLERATASLDDQDRVSDAALRTLREDLDQAMNNCYAVFRQHAFRKWSLKTSGLNPINRPLFESWSYVLTDHSEADLLHRRSAIVAGVRDAMTNLQEYIDAISTSTGDPRKVRIRFEVAAALAGVTA